jgi:hypothetical protein
MRRLAEFADETCLSQGDLLRFTEDAIDTKTGIIRLNFGRGKTGVEAGSSPNLALQANLGRNRSRSEAVQG